MKTLIAIAMAAATLPAAAQTIYRCGSEYSQESCRDAKVVPAVNSASSERDQQKAREAAMRDAKAADAMEKARLKEEAKPVSAYIPPKKTEEEPADTGKPLMDKPKKPQYFTAVVPGTKKKKAAPKKKRHAT